MSFMETLRSAWQRNDSLVCVGLDPEPARFPDAISHDADGVFAFCRAIVDATADLVCCFKPQIAHFAALRAESALERLIAHIHDAHPGMPLALPRSTTPAKPSTVTAPMRSRSIPTWAEIPCSRFLIVQTRV